MKTNTIIVVTMLSIMSYYQAFGQCASPANIYAFNYNGKTYEIVKENKTWANAAACAVSKGGALAEINDAAENAALFTELTTNAGIVVSSTIAPDGGGGSYVWLGGNDLLVEGNWIWDGDNMNGGPQFWMGTANGNPVGGLYNNWGNEPDNFNGQDALGLSLNGWPLGVASEWNDVDHLNTLYFVIEHPGILCTSTSSTISPISCNSYTSPSGNIWNTSNTYSDTILNAAGCDSVITINLTINTADTSVSLSGNTITSNAMNAKYQWLNCTSQALLVGDTNQSFTPNANGDYAVIVTENGCTDTSACTSITGIGLNDLNLNPALEIYPNPSHGQFTISTHGIDSFTIEVRSSTGQMVYHKSDVTDPAIEVNLQSKPGMYLVLISADDVWIRQRLIIE